MRYTRENILEGIDKKIDKADAMDGFKWIWRKKIPNYPVEIEQNVLEWVNNEPISYVDCHGESIFKIMELYHLTEWSIPVLICNFVDFKETEFTVRETCIRGVVL